MANCSFLKATEARFLARNHTLLWSEICEIQAAILAAINSNQYSTIVNDNTPFTETQSILSVTVTGAGTDYDLVTATATIEPPVGAGVTAIVDEVLVVNGVITGFTFTNPGTTYDGTEAITIHHPTGSGFIGVIQHTGGVITGISIQDGGLGYGSLLPTAAIVDPTGSSAVLSVNLDEQDETDFDGVGDNGTFVGGDGAGGTAYAVTDTITLSNGTEITVDAIDVNGDVTEFTLANTTFFASAASTVLTQTSTSGSGTGFTLTTGPNNGLTIDVTSGGFGYTAPSVVISPAVGDDTAFTISTNSSGVVSAVTIVNPGYGYTSGGTFTITTASGLAGNDDAVITYTVEDGSIDTAVVNPSGGSGYTASQMNQPVAVADLPTSDDFGIVGNGATATATAATNTFGTTPSNYYEELIGQTSNRVVADQIQFILDYFTALGYNIRAQVNPATNSSIQWQIIW